MAQNNDDFFSNFLQIDSLIRHERWDRKDRIPFHLSIKKRKKLKSGIYAFKFKMKFDNKTTLFWLGMNKSQVFSFRRNKLKFPIVIFELNKQLQQNPVEIYPFSKSYVINHLNPNITKDFTTNNFESFEFIFKRKKLNQDSFIAYMNFSLNEGIFFTISHQGATYY
jgi:hypothetical protein